MSWKEAGVSEERLRFVIEASQPGRSMAALCREYGVSRQTGYVWLERYEEQGAAGVWSERSRCPHSSPSRAPEEVSAAVRAARAERPDWGARKLAHVIRAAHPELTPVSTSTLQRILNREGLIAAADRHPPARRRFERKQANELWQMDFKGPQGFNQRSGPLSILDDYSRYLIGLVQLPANNTSYVRGALQEAFEQYGLPEQMLLDHGKPWYDAVNAWGWTELTVWILRQGVRLTFSRVRHPQTQGKVERMHGALQRAVRQRKPAADQQSWLDEFRHEYNHLRPHEAIGMATPATRWQPSPRQFDPHPGEWEYPEGWEVFRLAGHGQFCYRGKRWEVSQALRGQLIALQHNGPRILVYYCNMPVREINLQTQTNRILPGNPFRLLQC